MSVEHWPKTTFSLSDFPGLLLSGSSLSDMISLTLHSFAIREDIDLTCAEEFLCCLAKLKFDSKPYFMLAMDEKTAVELIIVGE